MSHRLGHKWVIAAVASLSLMAWGTTWTLTQGGDLFSSQPKRFWEDVGLAIGCRLSGGFPVTYNPFLKIREPDHGPRYVEPRGLLARSVAENGMAPWEFWRTVDAEGFRKWVQPKPFPRFDDAGRPLLLCLTFRALGGVAPYAIFWLGFLVAAPVVLWIAFEFGRAERPWAGAVALLLFGSSPFLVESLALPYAAIGFYLVAVLVLIALAVYANLGRPSRRGLLGRAAFGGAVFAIGALCRGSALLLLPGVVVAFAIAAARAEGEATGAPAKGPGRRRRWPFWACLALVLFLLPWVAAALVVKRMTARTLAASGDSRTIPQHHPVWYNLWIGLGDFDRTKGYVWEDGVASALVVRNGGAPITPSFLDPEAEQILRDAMLADVRSDPVWYAGILGRRLLTTLTQWKLRPWRPLDGVSMAPRSHPSEGVIDSYYTLTTTVDVLGAGPHRLEMPLPLLVLPSWALVALAWRRRPGPGRDRGRASAAVLGCVAAGALVLPVSVTTAGGIETEAFALVYLLGIAFVVEELALGWSAWSRTRTRPKPP